MQRTRVLCTHTYGIWRWTLASIRDPACIGTMHSDPRRVLETWLVYETRLLLEEIWHVNFLSVFVCVLAIVRVTCVNTVLYRDVNDLQLFRVFNILITVNGDSDGDWLWIFWIDDVDDDNELNGEPYKFCWWSGKMCIVRVVWLLLSWQCFRLQVWLLPKSTLLVLKVFSECWSKMVMERSRCRGGEVD